MDSPLLTKEEAADYLRLSTKTLARLDVPRIKLGRLVRYLRADLDTFAEGSRVAPQTAVRLLPRSIRAARAPKGERVGIDALLARYAS